MDGRYTGRVGNFRRIPVRIKHGRLSCKCFAYDSLSIQYLTDSAYRDIHNSICPFAPKTFPIKSVTLRFIELLSMFIIHTTSPPTLDMSIAIQHSNIGRIVNYILDAIHRQG